MDHVPAGFSTNQPPRGRQGRQLNLLGVVRLIRSFSSLEHNQREVSQGMALCEPLTSQSSEFLTPGFGGDHTVR
jgi:hypothetical protein